MHLPGARRRRDLGPHPSGAAIFPNGSPNRPGCPKRLDIGALSSWAPQTPASVPGGVQRPQRLAGEMVCAEEEHPPGRLFADSGTPAILPTRRPAEPGQRLPPGARPSARAATRWQGAPPAPNQHPHLLCGLAYLAQARRGERARARPEGRARGGAPEGRGLSASGGGDCQVRGVAVLLELARACDVCCIYLHDSANLSKILLGTNLTYFQKTNSHHLHNSVIFSAIMVTDIYCVFTTCRVSAKHFILISSVKSHINHTRWLLLQPFY